MFKEFVISIISLAFLCTVSDMIMPEGSMKKYFKLAMGFMMMCVLISPVTKIIDIAPFEFSFKQDMSNEEISAKSDAYILKMHEENIREHILNIIGNNAEAFVEINSDGTVKNVVIRCSYVSEGTLKSLKSELGCENIKVISEDEHGT